jgi:hypothetical protein
VRDEWADLSEKDESRSVFESSTLRQNPDVFNFVSYRFHNLRGKVEKARIESNNDREFGLIQGQKGEITVSLRQTRMMLRYLSAIEFSTCFDFSQASESDVLFEPSMVVNNALFNTYHPLQFRNQYKITGLRVMDTSMKLESAALA